ncbi:hypothetical protein [Streptomyces subrutilus]|uniref:hypothetical protein n=1 Tax=Streptomyces subrutilus TaxID=36818 RepID=UPI00114CFE2F|nr:hypothetical protein [Streptomyces subrutilus]
MTTNMPFAPQALARHYYEARREVLALAGITATPWYQLSADERAIADAEGQIVQEAFRRAAEEQQAIDALPHRSATAAAEGAERPPLPVRKRPAGAAAA